MSAASRRVAKRDKKRQEVADDLTMLASQLQEALRGEGDMPSPWTFDDWFTRYRDVYSGGDAP